MTGPGRAVEFARLALATSCVWNARSRAASTSAAVLSALAGARHALQAACVIAADVRAMHRLARTVDRIHAVSMALLWMGSPSHARFASRQLLGTLGMVVLESLAVQTGKVRR